jgi:hypothetical protein
MGVKKQAIISVVFIPPTTLGQSQGADEQFAFHVALSLIKMDSSSLLYQTSPQYFREAYQPE